MKSFLLWLLAFFLTIGSAYYQRITGPTYPISETKSFGNSNFSYKLDRSHSTSSDYEIKIPVKDSSISGFISWKRFKTNDEWTVSKMSFENGTLIANLPKQPAAGKLEYQVKFVHRDKELVANNGNPIIIRFKGDVPPAILIPHVIFIFAAMLFSLRTGIEALLKRQNIKKLTFYTVGVLILGGMIFGPLTQLYAFGALWTGFPFGYDLTDNKTLIAAIFWFIALASVILKKRERLFVIIAALVMLIIFLIPHSMFGSELDYNKLDKEKSKTINLINK